MMNLLAVVILIAASAAPAPQWTPAYSSTYQLRVPRGEARAVLLHVPASLGGVERPLTLSWAIIRPVPAPQLVVFEQCSQPDVCYPGVMRPTGQASATTRTTFRVTNRSGQDLEIQFRYRVWAAK
jgi:hypothetical protein